MCSLASQTCRRTGLLNCCHGIGTIRTCRWSLELGIMLYAIRGPRRVLSKNPAVRQICTADDVLDAVYEQRAITAALCWAHARRQFFELALAANARRGKNAAAIS